MRSHPERDAFPIPLLRSPSARERAAESTSHQLICSRNQIAAGGWEQLGVGDETRASIPILPCGHAVSCNPLVPSGSCYYYVLCL